MHSFDILKAHLAHLIRVVARPALGLGTVAVAAVSVAACGSSNSTTGAATSTLANISVLTSNGVDSSPAVSPTVSPAVAPDPISHQQLPPPTSHSTACTIADVSGSVEDPQLRATYTGDFAKFATTMGQDGNGKMCLILAAGDPIAEGTPRWAFVGPTPNDQGTDQAAAEIQGNVEAASHGVQNLLANPPIEVQGSALIEATVDAAQYLQPGDWLLFETDGVQQGTSIGDFHHLDLSPQGISHLLAKLNREGFLPDLTGVRVVMPALLDHPGGNAMSLGQEERIQDFWAAFFHATGAELTTALPTGTST